MDDTTIGGVQVELLGATSLANFANPALGLLGDAVGALALVVGDINVDAGKLGTMADEGHGDDVLEGAEIVGFATDE